MMSNFLKSSAVRDAAIQALSRMLTLAPTVWRDAAGSFRGDHGDTITIRVPAYTVANKRSLRSNDPRDRRGLFEAAVPVSLDSHLYRDVPLTDENQTLDILNFSRQVLNPMLQSVARGIEDVLLEDAILSANYEHEVDMSASEPYAGVTMARKHLLDSRVPDDGQWTLAVGTSVEAALLTAPQFAHVSKSGSSAALRQGLIGSISGFNVLTSPGLPPDEAYAYHRTAYALSLQAPLVPAGAPAGFVASEDGFAIRVVQVLDSNSIQNIVAADVFAGASPVMDFGSLDDGVFTPAEEPDESGVEAKFVRGVKIELSS